MQRSWPKLGGQLGMACIGIGFIVIGLAWNGAAGVDFVQGQVPYLLSGGAFGLALVIAGAALVVVQNSRRDRSMLEGQLRELNTAVARLANAVGSIAAAGNGRGAATDEVVMGRTSFHRPECHLVAGKDLPVGTVESALEDGLSACRICEPAAAPARSR